MSAAKATSRVRPILVNEKKAELIKAKLAGADLQEIAKANNTNVRNCKWGNFKKLQHLVWCRCRAKNCWCNV